MVNECVRVQFEFLHKPDAQDVTSKVKSVERDDAIFFLGELTKDERAMVE